jgi:hypothetical protein
VEGAPTRVRVRWLVCAQATRDVIDGFVVDCPLGGDVSVDWCSGCHLLQVLESEWRQPSCATPER